MMFMVQCLDKPESLALRQATRPAHLDYVKARIDHIVVAGALLADDNESMIGSGYVLSFDDRQQVEAFFADDPYVKAGLYQSITIKPYRKALP
jgi:uncharacterized protein YciI